MLTKPGLRGWAMWEGDSREAGEEPRGGDGPQTLQVLRARPEARHLLVQGPLSTSLSQSVRRFREHEYEKVTGTNQASIRHSLQRGTSMAGTRAEGTTSRWPEQQSRLSRRPRQPLGWVATAPGVLEALARGQAWPAHFGEGVRAAATEQSQDEAEEPFSSHADLLQAGGGAMWGLRGKLQSSQ